MAPILAGTDDNIPSHEEKLMLIKLVFGSTLWGYDVDMELWKIENCTDYKDFEKMQFYLESIQKPFDHISNPSATDIKIHLKKLIQNDKS